MTGHERRVLRWLIECQHYLEINDEVPDEPGGFLVYDRRSMLGVCIETEEQLKDLCQMGAEWFLESVHNGGKLKRA